MTAAPDRRAVLGAVLAGAACLPSPAIAAIPSPRDSRVAAMAKRIGELVLRREANRKAIDAAADRFKLPPTPRELLATYRGPFGSVHVEADPDWLRETISGLSPRSRRGRQLRRLLSLHEEHYTRVWMDREASGLGALVDEHERIERDLKAAAAEVCDLESSGEARAALQAATLLVKGDGARDVPTALLGLLEVAGAA